MSVGGFYERNRLQGGIMKYRKKPVVIEAFNYDGDLMDKDGELLCSAVGSGSA